jgi:hypothetical protein
MGSGILFKESADHVAFVAILVAGEGAFVDGAISPRVEFEDPAGEVPPLVIGELL